MKMVKNMKRDLHYDIACTIIQAFQKDYPSPKAHDVAHALMLGSEISGELETDKVIEWAENYASEWYKKNMM